MKNSIILTCAAVIVSSASFANPAQRSIQLQGQVAKFCKLDGVLASGPGAAGFAISGDAVTISNFAGADGKHPGAEIQLVIPNALCNAPATITLASANNGLANASASDIDAWDRRVTYSAIANWNGLQSELNTQQGTVTAASATSSAELTDLTILINTMPTAKPLQAGTYSDTLTVTLDVVL
jgi:hypothetical protein